MLSIACIVEFSDSLIVSILLCHLVKGFPRNMTANDNTIRHGNGPRHS